MLWLVTVLAGCAPVPPPQPATPRCVSPAPAGAPRAPVLASGPLIAADDVRADFEGWLAQMAALHPDLSLRTDLAGFERTRAAIVAAIDRPMTQREAWLLFARLNPYLRDGHNGIQMPDRAALAQAHVDAGGRIFPFTVHLGSDGLLRVRDATAGVARGARILAINGRAADQVIAEMLAVTEGDTPAFRRELVARRFVVLHWLLFGDTRDYAVTLDDGAGCPRQLLVPGATTLAPSDQPKVPASSRFAYQILAGEVGYLKAGSFLGEYDEALARVARQAFTEFKARGIRALIIDVRDNGGGDDPMWQNHLMEYITAKPYAQVGRFAVRVNQHNAGPGDVIGEVQRKDYKKRFTPSPVQPLRFVGPVYLLAGRFSYSSAIQFLVAAQDFGIARIAGRETGGLACQTGKLTEIAMPRTGLRAYAPVMAFIRPSGHGCERGVIPELAVDDDGLDPDRAPALLARMIESATTNRVDR